MEELSFDILCQKLEGEPFSLSRYGDGEWACLSGFQGSNCHGDDYDDSLREKLLQTVSQPLPYTYMTTPEMLVKRSNIEVGVKDVPWVFDARIFWRAVLEKRVQEFMDALCFHRVGMVAPAHLKKMKGVEFKSFIEIPGHNCYENEDEIVASVLRAKNECDVFLFAGGMAAKAFIYDLFPLLGNSHFLIDIGSVFDSSVGVYSRSYMRPKRGKPKRG